MNWVIYENNLNQDEAGVCRHHKPETQISSQETEMYQHLHIFSCLFAKGIIQARNSLDLIYTICTSFIARETRGGKIYNKQTERRCVEK